MADRIENALRGIEAAQAARREARESGLAPALQMRVCGHVGDVPVFWSIEIPMRSYSTRERRNLRDRAISRLKQAHPDVTGPFTHKMIEYTKEKES